MDYDVDETPEWQYDAGLHDWLVENGVDTFRVERDTERYKAANLWLRTGMSRACSAIETGCDWNKAVAILAEVMRTEPGAAVVAIGGQPENEIDDAWHERLRDEFGEIV